MQIKFATFQSVQLTYREVVGLFQHPYSIALMLATLGVFALAKPHAVAMPDFPIHQLVLLWANSIIGFFVLYLGAVWLCERRNHNLFTPAILIVISLYQTVGGAALLPLLGHSGVSLRLIVEMTLFHIVILLLLDVVFASFILPRLLPQIRTQNPVAAPPKVAPDEPQLALLGHRFEASELRYISSKEHYVEITTLSCKTLLRGRISDIEAQIPSALGLMIHRSHWVAKAGVAGLQRGATWEIILGCGARLPVARGRRDVVRKWVESHGLPVQ